ncbi:hypothetical protein B0H19DRAFT_1062303 [Mycena capillaripes]|nr:hypothetical protein B0H19DRAFT_1062303 [Mycena capillaripes]
MAPAFGAVLALLHALAVGAGCSGVLERPVSPAHARASAQLGGWLRTGVVPCPPSRTPSLFHSPFPRSPYNAKPSGRAPKPTRRNPYPRPCARRTPAARGSEHVRAYGGKGACVVRCAGLVEVVGVLWAVREGGRVCAFGGISREEKGVECGSEEDTRNGHLRGADARKTGERRSAERETETLVWAGPSTYCGLIRLERYMKEKSPGITMPEILTFKA